ncbi:hypothetical protein Rhopal_004825-T1 [Rhodotorula paludigena]|uniref:Pentacotripeptide-repeat region of PRORP domain-containing protein n=1 Tax=Rhodotorula paludigena TaxID=86838 RepID=A0AAV5GQP4_9BASI|nr:hypothetical protein Rhopal_004825-T1 [Rhodotorula paludigena]
MLIPLLLAEANDPAEEALARLLAEHAPEILPSTRGTGLKRPRTPPRRRAPWERQPVLRLDIPTAKQKLQALWKAAEDPSFFHALDPQRQLDLIRSFSRVARAVDAPPRTDPLASRNSPEEQRRLDLRAYASKRMLALLRSSRHHLTALAALGTSPYSSLRQNAALLFLDAVTLAESLEAISVALLGAPDDGSAEAKELSEALDALFRPSWSPSAAVAPASAPDDALAAQPSPPDATATLLQSRRTALSHLLQLWQRPSSSPSLAASQALALLLPTTYALDLEPLFTTTVRGSQATHRAQRGFGDVLRRQYGVVLAALEPSPADALLRMLHEADGRGAGAQVEAVEQAASVVVRLLAESGSAVRALDLWRVLEVRREDREAGEVEAGREAQLERLKTMTALVNGLSMERLYDDANAVAYPPLERLAESLQGEVNVSPATDSQTVSGSVCYPTSSPVIDAYRVLAKLASDQGRSPIVERLLGSLAAIGVSDSTSLEFAARRLRAKGDRRDLEAAREAFDSAPLAKASPADRARLYGQLAVAHVRVNDVEGALRVLRELVQTRLYAPLFAINAVLHGFARRGDFKSTFDLFQQLAQGAFPRLAPNANSWNALVLAHSVARDPSGAEAAIAEMKRVGLEPGRDTWTTLMSTYVENGLWRAAFAVYRFLDSQSDPRLCPDTATINVMLKACILTATKAETVLSLFRNALSRGVRPDMITYTLVLQSVCAAGHMSVAEEIYSLIERAERTPGLLPSTMRSAIVPDHFVFANLIAGYSRSGDMAKAQACLAEMRARGIEPSSITVGIIVGARLLSIQADNQGRRLAAAVWRATAEARAFLESGSFPLVSTGLKGEATPRKRRRARQPVAMDQPLARGRAAIAVYAPILRALTKSGDARDAIKLFDEVLDRLDEDLLDTDPPIELYSMLMDAFRQKEVPLTPSQARAAAKNVHLVWQRLYESVKRRFLRPAQAEGGESGPLRVDPAQADVLRVPLSILLDAAGRGQLHMVVESTWRRLAAEGFAFDASNWNALALYFIRDMQLRRAMWITEHVLCRPGTLDDLDGDSSDPSTLAEFEKELRSIRRADAVGRTPARIWAAGLRERDLRSRRQEAYQALLHQIPPSSPAGSTAGFSVQLGEALSAAHASRSAALWHPYGRTLVELHQALDSLSGEGSIRALRKFNARLGKDDAVDLEVERGQMVKLAPDDALDERQALERDHPLTMRSLELWRTRRERAAAERQARSHYGGNRPAHIPFPQ